ALQIVRENTTVPEHSDEKIREAGVFVLSRMKGNAVEELLKKMLHDDSLEVRTRVILAMSYQKNPVYIDALREFFRIAADSDKAMARKAIVYLQGFVERQK
ncbi:MAG TPA: HEAT repeat domain-containing protein, partial [Candidatus Rifleibacterium sp.]|nr:HEAT repeat domain-containing protein [Candidatus Rifleibacterium sp.]